MSGQVPFGVFGKLPSRGDFVRFGIPHALVLELEGWIGAELREAERAFGTELAAIWHRAPGWHFALGPGLLIADRAVSGVWVPSVDQVGRLFPLLLLAPHPPHLRLDHALPELEEVLQNAVADAIEPEALQARIAACGARHPPRSGPVAPGRWWRGAGALDGQAAIATGLPRNGDFLALLAQANYHND